MIPQLETPFDEIRSIVKEVDRLRGLAESNRAYAEELKRTERPVGVVINLWKMQLLNPEERLLVAGIFLDRAIRYEQEAEQLQASLFRD